MGFALAGRKYFYAPGVLARTLATRHLPQALVSGEVVFHATPFRFDTLLVGALIALLYRGAHRDEMQKAAQAVLAIAVLCTLAVGAY